MRLLSAVLDHKYRQRQCQKSKSARKTTLLFEVNPIKGLGSHQKNVCDDSTTVLRKIGRLGKVSSGGNIRVLNARIQSAPQPYDSSFSTS